MPAPRLTLLRAALALAALAAGPVAAPVARAQAPKPVSAIDFTEVLVVAERVEPAGAVVWTRPPTKHKNLIELRSNFRPELSRSASKLAARGALP